MRLIDADKLKRKAQKIATDAWRMKLKGNVETILNEFIDWIDASPTIENTEPKTGKWLEDDDATVRGHCSVCGWESHYYEDDVVGANFCPNCGAKMEEQNAKI